MNRDRIPPPPRCLIWRTRRRVASPTHSWRAGGAGFPLRNRNHSRVPLGLGGDWRQRAGFRYSAVNQFDLLLLRYSPGRLEMDISAIAAASAMEPERTATDALRPR